MIYHNLSHDFSLSRSSQASEETELKQSGHYIFHNKTKKFFNCIFNIHNLKKHHFATL